MMFICMTLLFGACSNANTPTNVANPGAVSDNAVTVQAERQAQSKIVHHLMGETEIPVKPERIVVDGLEDIMLALQVPIVQANSMEGHYLYDRLQERHIPVLEVSDNINYEGILEAAPDVIIASNLSVYEQAIYDNLTKIAPTIVYDRGDWKTSIQAIGEALDLATEAQAVIQAYDDKLQQARKDIAAAAGGKSVAIIRPSVKDVQVFFPAFAYTGLLYNELGFQVSPAIADMQKKQEEGLWGEVLSLEKLPELDADYLFVTVGGSYATEEDYQQSLQELAEVENMMVWQRNPAVQQNQVYKVSSRHWMLNGPIADGMKIDDVVAAVTGK